MPMMMPDAEYHVLDRTSRRKPSCELWYTNFTSSTIHLETELLAAGLCTPFWYVMNKQSVFPLNGLVLSKYCFKALHGHNRRSLSSVANDAKYGIKIGSHGFPSLCVLAINWRFGNKRTPVCPNLILLSFTDKAWISLTCAADANAIKNTVFHVKNLRSIESKGSNGLSHKAHNTFGRSQFGRSDFVGGHLLKTPLIRADMSLLALTELPFHPLWTELIADL